MERISSNAGKRISQLLRLGSIASYKSAWSKWTSWCVRETMDPFCVPLSTILKYLSTLLDEDLQYQTVNSHRAAISAYHNFINGEPISKHPKICALPTRTFNERPSQPRYASI